MTYHVVHRYKPYQVWIKQDYAPAYCVFGSDNPMECKEFARERIYHGNNVEWIEVRDGSGVLETIWKRGWR